MVDQWTLVVLKAASYSLELQHCVRKPQALSLHLTLYSLSSFSVVHNILASSLSVRRYVISFALERYLRLFALVVEATHLKRKLKAHHYKKKNIIM